MRRSGISLAVLGSAVFFALISAAQQPRIKTTHGSSDHPLCRIDLLPYDYPADGADLQRRRGFANFDTITFVSENTLAATFVTRENIADLQRREDPNHLRPYRLHAIFLDSTLGKLVRSLDWPIDDPNAGIFPRNGGGFLLVTADRIVSYSAEWVQLKELLLSELHPTTADLGGIAESPGGNTLVIQFIRGAAALCLSVRTDSLDYSQIPCGVLEVFTASDSGIIAPKKLSGGNNLHETGSAGARIEYGIAMPDAPDDSGRRTLNPDQARSARTICSPCVGMPQFINEEMIAVYSPTYVSIVNRAGQVKFTQDYSPSVEWIDELGRPVRASANGMRFAIASNKSPFRTADAGPLGPEPGRNVEQERDTKDNAQTHPLNSIAIQMSTGDIPAEFPLNVQVYDLAASRWIYTLQINSDRLHQIWGLALSPRGEKLAIDSGGVIQVFTLPPKTDVSIRR